MVESSGKPAAKRILIVDDDQELCELLAEYLGRESFTVECVHDGESGLQRALKGRFDAMVLDVMLPAITGFEVIRTLRRTSNLPILMLTARGEDVDRIVGLELGADDYLPKPFNPRELVARIHAVLRRASPVLPAAASDGVPAQPPIRVQSLAAWPDRREVTLAGRELSLTTVEFDVLCLLMRSAGRVVSRGEISKAALGRVYTPYDRSVDMHVMNLRRKLQSTAQAGVTIKTVRSAGYMLVASPQGSQARDGRPSGRRQA
jgi:two-component system response regulator CpxR